VKQPAMEETIRTTDALHAADAVPAVDDDAAAGLVLDGERSSRTRCAIRARFAGQLIHQDTLDPRQANARRRFTKEVARKVAELGEYKIEASDIDRALMDVADRIAEAGPAAATPAPAEYWSVDDEDDPERSGIYRRTAAGESKLTNFVVRIEREVKVHDDVQGEARFEGTVRLHGREHPFAIPARDYADGRKLQGVLYEAAGAQARFLGDPRQLQDACSALSEPARIERTTNFGWVADGTAYLAPSGVVTAEGFRDYRDGEVQVDLGAEQAARWLDLRGLEPDELRDTKRHLVEDLLPLHDRAVMYSLLGAVALAPLLRFVPGVNRFGLWLRGTTGEGKSFAAKLAQNFYGDFPIEDGSRVGSWTSTVGFTQRQGFYFKDAFYLVDDFKPESVKHHEVVKLLQNYADNSARGRLNADATTKASREVRGLLVATGEDIPEHSASALSRLVVVEVPRRAKDIERGSRCLRWRPAYRGVMADFLRWTIAGGRPEAFRGRVAVLQRAYYEPIAGRQNDLRIATNFALLGAAFEEFAAYLADAWDGAKAEAATFIEVDLPAMRDRMVGAVQDQLPSAIFLEELRTLIATGRVRLAAGPRSIPPERNDRIDRIPLVGRKVPMSMGGESTGRAKDPVVEISLKSALREIQRSLTDQRRPELKASESALVDQFIADGLLLDCEGVAFEIGQKGEKTYNRRVEGAQLRVARFPAWVLLGGAANGDHEPDAVAANGDDDSPDDE